MIERYFGARVPAFDNPAAVGCPFESVESLLEDVDQHMCNYEVDVAVRRVWDVVREANRYVVDQQPWNLARQEDDVSQRQLRTVLYNLVEAIRIITAFAAPCIPSKTAEIARAFSFGAEWDRLSERHLGWGLTRPGSRIERISALFPKDQTVGAAS
jgi:methionyl-tRNA synthetase